MLAELFADGPLANGDATAQPTEDKPASTQALLERIRAAYMRLAKRPRDWVYLADIHAQLNGVSKAEIDGTLRNMFHAREVSLTLEEDQASLTKAQRSAALRLGADDMHLLSME